MSRDAVIEQIESAYLKADIPDFSIGDTLKIHTKIIEGNKERVQVFIGTVIARKGKGLSETISLHRVAFGQGMERVFLLHSPRIVKIEVARKGKVRRAKLYYLRGTSGKAAKVPEKILAGRSKKGKPAKEAAPSPEPKAKDVSVSEPVSEAEEAETT